jgi:hypothetical protein
MYISLYIYISIKIFSEKKKKFKFIKFKYIYNTGFYLQLDYIDKFKNFKCFRSILFEGRL